MALSVLVLVVDARAQEPQQQQQQFDPPTRVAHWVLDYQSGLVKVAGVPSGGWRLSELPGNRYRRSRVRIAEVLTTDGVHLLISIAQPAPARGDSEEDYQVMAMVELGDSLWFPLNGQGKVRELGDGSFEVFVLLAEVVKK